MWWCEIIPPDLSFDIDTKLQTFVLYISKYVCMSHLAPAGIYERFHSEINTLCTN